MAIIVKTDEGTIPFSRNILANSLSIAGLDFLKAYEIAEDIREQFESKKIKLIESKKIVALAQKELNKKGKQFAKRYYFWRNFKRKKDPLIILLGGGTGVGTTRIGLEVSRRLLISHISTDIVRSVLRSVIPNYLIPSLHVSSFLAGENLDSPSKLPLKQQVLIGFRRHIEPIARSIDFALVRAIQEGIPIILEGVSLVPGFISERILNHPFVHFFIINVDAKTHRTRFKLREYQTKRRRSADRYLNNFKKIRIVHEYILKQAQKHKIPIINSENAELCTIKILDLVTKRMMRAYKNNNT